MNAPRSWGAAGINTGTAPSKTLRASALYFSGLKQHGHCGIDYLRLWCNDRPVHTENLCDGVRLTMKGGKILETGAARRDALPVRAWERI